MSIYVGNLHYQVTEEDLEEVSVEHGKVNWIQFSTDRETVRRLGFFPFWKWNLKRKKMQQQLKH